MISWLKLQLQLAQDKALELLQSEAELLAYFYATTPGFCDTWVDGGLLHLVKDGQEFLDEVAWEAIDKLKFHPQHQNNFRSRFAANLARPISWKKLERVLKVTILREINKNEENWDLWGPDPWGFDLR